jgi:hypothetical protein
VVDVDRRRIGRGRPGRVTRLLERRFHELAVSSGTPIG